MQTRLSPSQTEYPTLTTEQLRASFLVESLFSPGRVELVYTDNDRAIVGSMNIDRVGFDFRRELGTLVTAHPIVSRLRAVFAGV